MTDQAPGAQKGLTILQAWEDYRSIVLPLSAGGARLKDCRRAFYAGCETVLSMLLRGGYGPEFEHPPLDPDAIALLSAELMRHKRDLLDGRA